MNDSINILITGDFSPHERITKLIQEEKTSHILNDFSTLIGKSDLNITNLETAIIHNLHTQAKKIGRNIGSDIKTLSFLKSSGFDLLTLANNHFMDYGEDSAQYAIENIKKNGLHYIGAGINEEEATKPFFFEKKGISIGIINACEHEFIGLKNGFHCNEIETVSLTRQIEDLKKKVDHVILILHGGDEHSSIPRPDMVNLYRFLIEHGTSVIINHHQHCVNGYEHYKNGIIFYGLGNFCFDRKDKRKQQWNYGYAVNLKIYKQNLEFQIVPYSQCNEYPQINILEGKELEKFNKLISNYNSIISNKDQLNSEYEKWLIKNRNRYLAYISPYSNKYLRFLVKKKLLPSFIHKSHAGILYLMNSCESHRKAIQNILENTFLT